MGLMQAVKGTSHGQTYEHHHVYDLTEAVKVEKLFLVDALDVLRHRYQDKAILDRHATKVDLQNGAHDEDWFFLDLLKIEAFIFYSRPTCVNDFYPEQNPQHLYYLLPA